MNKAIDMIGIRCGRLLVVSRAANYASGKARFVCLCDCGTSTIVGGHALRSAETKSCGCWRIEMPSLLFTTHGMSCSSEHRIWCHIKTRCYNPRNQFFARYGGRGISMCPTWVESFETFYRDMGPRPSSQHSIDRVNNDGNYQLDNCRWGTHQQQSDNRSVVKRVTFDGVTDTMAGWARRTGIPYMKLRRRIVDGWPPWRALESKDAAVRAASPPPPEQS